MLSSPRFSLSGLTRTALREMARTARLPTRLVGLALLLAIFSLAGLTLFAVSAITSVDQQSVARETAFVQRGIAEHVSHIPTEQESSTVWDEAVLRVKANDQAWIQDNLGVWMGSYFGHDRAYVLDYRNAPIYAMKDGKTQPVSAFDADRATVQPLVRRLRAAMTKTSEGLKDSTAAIAKLGAEDFALLDGALAIVSVKPIIPDTDKVTQAPGTEYLHVSVVVLNAKFVAEIAAQYALQNARLSPTNLPPGAFAVPIRNSEGAILGFFEWDANLPGRSTIGGMGPALVTFAVAGFGLTAWLLTRLRRSTGQLQASEERARFMALHDGLTGLPNRTLFDDRLGQALARSHRSGAKVAMLSIDIDRFKNINDSLGHPAGDELVRQLGARLAGVVRETDTVARLGGDEFAVLQTDVDQEWHAERLAERILAETRLPFDLDGRQAFVSVSIGLVVSQSRVTTAVDMLRQADIALYEAKAKGRGRYEIFLGGMDDVVRHRRLIEEDLRTAIGGDTQLSVAYQPMYAADGTTILGAEALLRWDHPNHGMLSPEVWIKIAEERGMIEPLGEWVLRQACKLACETDLGWVAVNVSPVQLRSTRFADRALEILAVSGLDKSRLQLEITESALIDDRGLAETSLARLHDAGIRIALDDFGTGYSSMAHLRQHSVDKIKIDQSFIQQLGSSDQSDAIVGAIVSLARAMHKQVAAEGVETIAHVGQLAALGCNELQGFAMSKPLFAPDLKALLASTAKDKQRLSA